MDFVHIIVEKFGKDLSPGRMFESMTLLAIIWSKLRPHLNKIESRLQGVETAVNIVTEEYKTGTERFNKIEGRVKVLEDIQNEGDPK